ncbi:PQ loop repeat protein [Massarina eburnea CBS 473.64]|uniref:PQ loop repeat protein n=1 Tax=Massarina eburnea CBS 473.64 TaxID=1395130 RepID=A0A6A6RIP9_9PLEO|nr:PQ loop repeat protein [Massarina eburnea CBS 473.64]
MAPQGEIPLVATVLGTIGTVFWCIQLVPQIIRNYRTKTTEGLPSAMMFMWSASGVPFGVYSIAQRFNIPLIVQPQCFCILCGVSWAQCMVYGRKWRPMTATIILLSLFAVFAGLQTGLVYAIRPAYARGIEWPVLLVGVIAFLVLIGGYFPIPFELMKRRGRVVGIDFVFLAIDWAGAFFSLMSLAAQSEFDSLFGTLYALCCVIEMSMVVSHLVWRFRTRGIRKRAKEQGKTFDEFDEGIEWQAKGIDLGAKFWKLIGKGGNLDTKDDEEDTTGEEVSTQPKNMVPNAVV